MGNFQVRTAASEDARSLASLHLACSALMPDRLENQLGAGYLAAYYRAYLAEPGSLVLCSDLDTQSLSGLIIGVTHYAAHLQHMRRSRWRFLSTAVPALLRQPPLLGKLLRLQRQPWISGSDEAILTAARITFWCWRPGAQPPGGGVVLLQAWLEAARARGVRCIYGDVDERSPRVTAIHRSLGATIQTQTFPDGSQQSLIRYDL